MSIARLSGGLTPADGADPRTFPAIWNATATDLESALDGGSAGQLLVKSSGSDYDADWVDEFPALHLGLLWGAGLWVGSPLTSTATSSRTVGTMSLLPVFVAATTSFDRIACEVTTQAAAGGVARLGVYSSGADFRPSTLLHDYGTVSTETLGVKEITISLTLGRGLYWLACVAQSQTFTARAFSGHANQSWFPLSSFGVTAGTTNQFTVTGVTGALPSPAGTLTTGTLGPIVQLRTV
jgi:hypothetical protein